MDQQRHRKMRIGDLLIEKGIITEDQLLLSLSRKFQMRFMDIGELMPSAETLELLPREMVTQLGVFPIEASRGRIVVATSNPTDLTVAEALRFRTRSHIELVAATSDQIRAAIAKHYQEDMGQPVDIVIDEMPEEDDVVVEEETDEYDFVSESDSQVIRFVNGILLDAYQKGVSDIHFEPDLGRGPLQVRYRKDGECFMTHKIPSTFKRAIISRIKIMSDLDIAEHRRPQSGKIVLRLKKGNIEYRVEVTPSVGQQEDAVLRILSSSKPLRLDEMGFSERNLERFSEAIARPYGIVLCVGPTGSGKTTALHSALGHINEPSRKIWTAEDPVEITQKGLRQVQVYPRIGFTFQTALRSFLRADPDVIMIGEMRDAETAKIAIEASLTGHLVFSTLHTNNAPETVTRLIEMGMDPVNFADALLGILAQRLARTFCDECKEMYHPKKEDYEILVENYGRKYFELDEMEDYSESFALTRRTGCATCSHTGLKGRMAIHELLMGTESVKMAIKKGSTAEELTRVAIDDGMRTLKMDGVQKVFKGHTDLSQVLLVCK
ncbi:GspE/PulE family protein [Thermodesulfobacteriota bacterium]